MDGSRMIFVAIGANLTSDRFGEPINACNAAFTALQAISGVKNCVASSWYASEPVPKSDQPWYVNGVASLDYDLTSRDLLGELQSIESNFGRVRTVPNAARVIDLDIIDFKGEIYESPDLTLPHSRLTDRAFVLYPLHELAPLWQHPKLKRSVDMLIARLPEGQICTKIS